MLLLSFLRCFCTVGSQAFLTGGFLLAFAGAKGFARLKVCAAFLLSTEDEEARMGHHAVIGTQAVGNGFPATYEYFAHFQIDKGTTLKAHQQVAHLLHRGQHKGQGSAGAPGLDHMVYVVSRRAHGAEECVSPRHA